MTVNHRRDPTGVSTIRQNPVRDGELADRHGKIGSRCGHEESASMESEPVQLASLEKAWQYHKDADYIFHSRIGSFVLAQSFLVLGYIASLSSNLQHHYPAIVRVAIIGLAVCYTLFFWAVCAWLFRGMEALKERYLRHDDVYKTYYDHTPNKPGEGPIRYFIPHGLPTVTLIFWTVIAMAEIGSWITKGIP
jgi:hypothetical protein